MSCHLVQILALEFNRLFSREEKPGIPQGGETRHTTGLLPRQNMNLSIKKPSLNIFDSCDTNRKAFADSGSSSWYAFLLLNHTTGFPSVLNI